MNIDLIKEYIKFSKLNQNEIIITTNNNKKMYVIISDIDLERVYYNFSNSKQDGQILIKNIKNCKFKSEEDEREFKYELISKKYCKSNFKEIVNNFEKYYMEILKLLKSKEIEDSKEYKYYEFKEKIYQTIFKNLYQEIDNLLINYFTGYINSLPDLSTDTILLLQQANLSQKKAIKSVLTDKISAIEGPPGTGKTTTIINIIANLIYQNQKVVIVSKNNSAIDNVVEELDQMNLPEFYIRLGNNDVMKELGNIISSKVYQQNKQLEEIEEVDRNIEAVKLRGLIQKINLLEENTNKLIKKKGTLNELENQLRHVLKKNDAYDVEDYKRTQTMLKKGLNNIAKIKRNLEYLSKILVKISDQKKIYLWDKILSYINLNSSITNLEQNGILLHLILEEKYLELEIQRLEDDLNFSNLDYMQKQIEELYKKDYIALSKKILLQSIKKYKNIELVNNIIKKAEEESDGENKIKKCKDDIIQLYPVILTTVDSILSNFQSYFSSGNKIDYVIIDEASQCDILSALPLLYIAKHIVIVGDSKQLSAIINILPEEIHNKVEHDYDYTEETFLSTMTKSLKLNSTLLMEHYRCDYNIINFCNKYFYDNQLIIYTEAKKDAISVINCDKGKYVRTNNGKSFYNEREIKTIDEIIENNIKDKFIITPFKEQANRLVQQYNKSQCGTIHTFQGRGEKEVYFSTVLNDTDRCQKHIQGKNNLFTKALINVAVSRAKKKFVLVTDNEFFKKYDTNIRDLIEYINVYGTNIPDKTICIFDYLYDKISTYQITDKCDNIYEKKLRDSLITYIDKHPEYNVKVKLPLAELVIDKDFLNRNSDIKKFVLNKGTHVDFTIYKNGIKKPILAIELDGEYHEMPEQQARDLKKNFALKHMEIDLWRINSKEVFTENDFYNLLEEKIHNAENEHISIFT